MKIDAHQHFWRLTNPFTTWPTPDLEAICRDFGPEDLQPHLASSGIDGTVLVQVSPDLEDTQFLLDIASHIPFVKGVVGWVDMEAPDVCQQIEDLSQNPLARGIRPMLQGLDERGWILRPEFEPVFAALIDKAMTFDGLVRVDQIPEITALALRHPELRIVLDHGGKPSIASGEIDEWAKDVQALAQAPNAYCKLSGLWTESGVDISRDIIEPYVKVLLETFGPQRLMWGSDWPVVQLVGTHGNWFDQCRAMLSDLSTADQDAVFGGTAVQFYGLKDD